MTAAVKEGQAVSTVAVEVGYKAKGVAEKEKAMAAVGSGAKVLVRLMIQSKC